MNQQLQQLTSDELFLRCFGTDAEMAHQPQQKPTKPKRDFRHGWDKFKPEVKTLATFSQLMTLAHNFNRRHGKQATKGCNCFSCKGSVKK